MMQTHQKARHTTGVGGEGGASSEEDTPQSFQKTHVQQDLCCHERLGWGALRSAATFTLS